MKNYTIKLILILLTLSDFILLNICLFISCYFFYGEKTYYSNNLYFSLFISLNVIWGFCSFFFRLYNEYTIYKAKDIQRATWRTLILHSILFIGFSWMKFFNNFPEELFFYFYTIS